MELLLLRNNNCWYKDHLLLLLQINCWFLLLHVNCWVGRRGRDSMVVGFTTTYAISAYHHWWCEFESRSGRGAQHYVIKFASDLRQVGSFLRVLWFLHEIIEILLKVVLNTIKQTSTVGMWNYCVIASCQLMVCVTIVSLLHVNCWYVELLCYCFRSTVGMWNYCVIASCQLLVCGTIVSLLHVNCWYVELLCYCFMSNDGVWNYCVIAACQLMVCGTIVLLLHVNW